MAVRVTWSFGPVPTTHVKCLEPCRIVPVSEIILGRRGIEKEPRSYGTPRVLILAEYNYHRPEREFTQRSRPSRLHRVFLFFLFLSRLASVSLFSQRDRAVSHSLNCKLYLLLNVCPVFYLYNSISLPLRVLLCFFFFFFSLSINRSYFCKFVSWDLFRPRSVSAFDILRSFALFCKYSTHFRVFNFLIYSVILRDFFLFRNELIRIGFVVFSNTPGWFCLNISLVYRHWFRVFIIISLYSIFWAIKVNNLYFFFFSSAEEVARVSSKSYYNLRKKLQFHIGAKKVCQSWSCLSRDVLKVNKTDSTKRLFCREGWSEWDQ